MATYDIAVFQHTSRPNAQELVGDAGSFALTGIRKLAQRFLIEMFQPRGTIPFAPDRGSDLLPAVRQGRVRHEVDAYQLFGLAVTQIEPFLRSIELETDPSDERFAGAEALGVAFHQAGIIYNISLRSMAGTERIVTMPVGTL